MSSLNRHSGALMSVRPTGVATTQLVTSASGGSGAVVTIPAPAGRVIGSVMICWLQSMASGGALWDPLPHNADWIDPGYWLSAGVAQGRVFHRIADGTSHDDLVVTKNGGDSTTIVAYTVCSLGYTGATLASGPAISNSDPSPVSGSFGQLTAPPAGLWLGLAFAADGAQPHTISGITVPNTSKIDTQDPGGSTDPYLELWADPTFAGTGGVYPTTPATAWSSTGGAGTFRAYAFTAVLTP